MLGVHPRMQCQAHGHPLVALLDIKIALVGLPSD